MDHHEEHTKRGQTITKQEMVVRGPNGEYRPMDFQPAFDVLKSVGLDRHITEDERRFLQVQ